MTRSLTHAVISVFAVAIVLTEASATAAYQYDGPKTLFSASSTCVSGGYSVPTGLGQGVAIHVKGFIPLSSQALSDTEILRITNPYAGSPFQVSSLALQIQRQANFSNDVKMTVSRTIIGPDSTPRKIPYAIADPVAVMPITMWSSSAATGPVNVAYFQAIDLWYYAFTNSTWIETQSGPSALGRSFDALTLFGLSEYIPFININVLNSCTTLPSYPFGSTRVSIYTLNYDDFQSNLDAEFAKADAPLTINGVPQLIRDHTPFISVGRRGVAASLL